MKPLPGIGEIWRDDLGRRFVVVGVEDGMIQVKSAKESKRDLAHSRGARRHSGPRGSGASCSRPITRELARSDYVEHAGKGVARDGKVWFDPPYVRLDDDPDDPDDEGPLFLTCATEDGSEATVLAPDCPDAHELERRVVVAFGDSGWTLDDYFDAKDPSCSG